MLQTFIFISYHMSSGSNTVLKCVVPLFRLLFYNYIFTCIINQRGFVRIHHTFLKLVTSLCILFSTKPLLSSLLKPFTLNSFSCSAFSHMFDYLHLLQYFAWVTKSQLPTWFLHVPSFCLRLSLATGFPTHITPSHAQTLLPIGFCLSTFISPIFQCLPHLNASLLPLTQFWVPSFHMYYKSNRSFEAKAFKCGLGDINKYNVFLGFYEII